jgi:glycosyltransferase involved in cell wall biosynthesis
MHSLVIPVYRNEDSIPVLLERLEGLQRTLDAPLEVVFVVDGSPDCSYRLLREGLARCSFSSELVQLSRNFGAFAAIRMGLSVARGPLFAVMAADLQEPPELVREFFTVLRDEPVDLVFGQRIEREDPFLSRVSAGLFWGLYRRLVMHDVPAGGVDVFGCNAQVRDALLRLNESNTSLVAQLFWVGFRRKLVPYQRQARYGGGRSAWTFRKRLRYMVDSIFAFTDLPISLLTTVGFLGVAVSAVVALVVFFAWLAGAIEVSGYTPIMLMLSFSAFVNLFSLGVLGQYLWRTFENSKSRPLGLPMTQESFRK